MACGNPSRAWWARGGWVNSRIWGGPGGAGSIREFRGTSSTGNGRTNGEAISKITSKIYSHLFLPKPLLLPGPFHVFHALSRPPPSPPVNIRDLPSKNTYHRRQPLHLPPLPPSSCPSCRGAEHIVIPSLPHPSTNHGRQPSSQED